MYVATQINFIVPGNEIDGNILIRVVRQSISGPEVMVKLVDGAPALHYSTAGYAAATNAWGTVTLTADTPAHPGDIVVVYATGLGKTQPNPSPGVIPKTAATLVESIGLQVYLDGQAVDPVRILYAGASPFSAGLYQINLELPDTVGTDPEIRVGIDGQVSVAGLKLAVR